MPHRRRLIPLALLPAVAVLTVLPSAPRAAEAPAAGVELFEKKVRPVLAQHCYRCHSAEAKKLRGGLRLDSRQAMLTGGDSGPAVVPGHPERSRLVEAVEYKNVELQMPPRGRLPESVVADLAAWVKMGAPWPQQQGSADAGPTRASFDLAQRKREHWAWQPIRPQTPPAVRDASWPRDPVDQFVLAKLEDRGLSPAKPADRRTLLRRLSFDLVGLPPSPAEVEAFANDRSPDAIERVVDRLLASPHFGERWGRHWLDLVRYAETRGHEFDYPIPNAYQYRDYVIRALNADVPYNQFVLEHVAGDLLPHPRRHPHEGFNESILGTGFWFLGEEVHSPVDIRQDQADRFDNKVDVLSKAFLGLTVACARCHDHKFDAISTRDYYALFGFLQSSHYRLARFDSMEDNRAVAAELWRLREKGRTAVQRAVADALRPGAGRMADYLLAAREAAQMGADSPKRVQAIAQSRRLDAALLARWVAHLAAAREENDPLHDWARPDALKRETQSSSDEKGTSIVLDYAASKPEDFLPDGFAFGPGPVRAGELHIGGDAAKPTLRFREHAAAEKDPTWDVLKAAPGSENDPGALGQVVRAGRTLRTPTFPLTTGNVCYLVRGSALVYAAVGSHVMIAGPLHGQIVRSVNTGEKFQWISHDLSAYRGQRIHLEFTPTGTADFALVRIVQGTRTPSLVERPNRLLQQALADAGTKARDATGSPLPLTPNPSPPKRGRGEEEGQPSPPKRATEEQIAGAYQRLVLDTLDRLAADRMVGSPEAADRARLANWLVRHADLFGTTDPGAAEAREFLVRLNEITARIRRESRLCVAMSDGSPENEYVFIRGSHKASGGVVPRRFLEALAGPEPLAVAHGSGRLELARQMVDPTLDPFLPRVLVNRVWHHLFGRGIVASTDNFGVLGERPTHPELLDHLADRFVREGWSLKKLIRALVLTSAYRMVSQSDAASGRADPDDLLLHRMRLRRLEGEVIRDAMLRVSGRLSNRLFGPPVLVHLTEFQAGRGRPASGPLDGDGRRSLYLSVRRNFLSPFLLAFDTPSPFSTVGRRTVSNVPAQSLILLNDPFVHEQARRWAERVLARPGSTRERIAGMYESAFSSPPTENEVTACLEFLERHKSATPPGDGPAAWADLAHVLFNVKDFIFVN